MINNLDIMIWGQKAGTLVSSKKGYKDQVCFYFDPQFVRSGIDIAPLRAPLTGIVAQRGLPVYPEENKAFGGLPSFVADSLPDHWGNVIFAEWAKSRHIRLKDLSPLDRLAFIGRRGMGALEFVPPASTEMEAPFRVEVAELARLAQVAMAEAKAFHVELTPGFAVESLFRVGTSAGGRRPKAVINYNAHTGECYSGQVAAPEPGFVPMIIKLDERGDVPTTQIEYSFYLMAQQAGMAMMPSQLLYSDGQAHFMTERFDRRGNEKIHVQTLAAMNPDASSYEDLFDVASHLDVSPQDMRQLFLLMSLNVASGNVDDHNKNFSFVMDKDCVWHAAPAYDFTFAVDPGAPAYVNRHSLSINGKNHEINRADLLDIAVKYSIKDASELLDATVDATGDFRKYAEVAGLDEKWTDVIESEMKLRRF